MFDGGPLPHEPIEPWRSFKQKLDRRALLHDRLKALGAFTGIAIGAIAGFEMVIGGGFDFITPRTEVREVAPSRYVTVQQVPWSPHATVIPLSSTEPLFAGEYAQVETAADELAGGYDDPSAPEMAFPEVNEDEIRARIAALYANDSGPTYADAAITYEDAPAIDEPQAGRAADPYAEAEAMVREALGGYDGKDIALSPS
jgi:hypothetical protein